MRNSIVIPSDANTSNMSNPGFRAAILVVSTTASTNPVDEHVIPTLKRVFAKEEEAKWKVTNTKIVRDDIDEIQRAITSWTDDESPVDLIVTSGGTGFSIDDVTPEVCESCIDERRVLKNFPGRLSSPTQACPWFCTWHACGIT